MSPRNAGARDSPADSELAPRDWVESIAEAEGISREEATERLVSSYWTFKEVLGLIERTDAEPALDREGGARPLPAAAGDERRPADADPEPGEPDLRRAITSLSARLDRLETRLDARCEAIEGRLDDELDHSEQLFGHLIDRTEAIQADLEAIAEAQSDDRRGRESRRELRELKHAAGRRGIDRATCAGCESSVSIALLTAAECPRCSRPFEDVEPAEGWLRSPTLTVGRTRTPGSETADPGPSPDEEAPTSGFRWGEDRE